MNNSLSPLSLRGINYYPLDYIGLNRPDGSNLWPKGPWAAPEEVWEKDMDVAQSLYINCVRVFIENKIPGDVNGFYDEDYVNRFDSFLRVASDRGIKAIPCGFWGATPSAYLPRIKKFIARFKDDSRIIMWEVLNEPHTPQHFSEVSDKLYHIKRKPDAYDKQRLTTVGVIRGVLRSIDDSQDLGDILQYHEYATDSILHGGIQKVEDYINQVHLKRPTKKLMIGEFGCPTSDRCPDGNHPHTENDQYKWYFNILSAAEKHKDTIVGLFPWMMFDYPAHISAGDKPWQAHYGIIKNDYSFKPAALLLRNTYSRWYRGEKMANTKFYLPPLAYKSNVISYFYPLGESYKKGKYRIRIYEVPKGTVAISAWMTQEKSGKPHSGTAKINVKSVQYHSGDRGCIIEFEIEDTNTEIPIGVMFFFGRNE